MIFGGTGDVLLKRGMQDFGPVDPHHLLHVISALGNPWVLGGIALLICFFADYLTALSWADLSYVLPVTSLGYVASALLARFFLHEQISPQRWAGTLLIVAGTVLVGMGTHAGEGSPAVLANHNESDVVERRAGVARGQSGDEL